MTAIDRVKKTKRSLSFIMGSSALLWGAAALFGVMVLGTLLGVLVALPPIMRTLIPIIAGIVGIATLAILVWRWRFAWSFDRVALWIEEKLPQLRYALVTAVDPRYKESAKALDPVISKADPGPFVRQAAMRSLLPAIGALAIGVVAYMFMPGTWKERAGISTILAGPDKPVVVGNRLLGIEATVTPPRYANMKVEQLSDPSTISALRGSAVVLRGEGVAEGLSATVQQSEEDEGTTIEVQQDEDGWFLALSLTDTVPAMLRLLDEHPSRPEKYTKPIVIDPRPDEIPVAKLVLPMRDTTFREIVGTLKMQATLNDDIGLGRAEFEVIVTTRDDGDDAKFVEHKFGASRFGGKRNGQIQFSIPMNKLGLTEGALITIRAAAYDNNTLYGPGVGYSESRTIRIATKGEYDTLNVNPAPPSADTALMTLRMLIIATEGLHKLKPTMEREKFVDSSYVLSAETRTIQRKVQRIMDEQTGNGEIAADPLLVTAVNALGEAYRAFMIAETGEALPQLYIAYDALNEYNKFTRYYPRGYPRIDPVNIDRVRLTGTDSGATNDRKPRPVADQDRDRLMADYRKAVLELKDSTAAQAVETLTLMRVQTMRKYPELAQVLGDAVAKIQANEDPAVPLGAARRVISGNIGVVGSLPVWSGAW